MSRFPPNRATRARLSRIEAVRTATEHAGEPLLRFRKVNGIPSALAMQIEDAGDDPEVVAHLLDALAAAVRAHVSEPAAADVLQVVEALRKAEAQRRP